MQEQKLETIDIKDVDGDIDDDTVMRFIEYAYSGDYTTPDPDIVQLSTDPDDLQEAFRSRLSSLSADESTSIYGIKLNKKERKRRSKPFFAEKSEASVEQSAILPEPGAESLPDDMVTGPILYKVDRDRRNLWNRFSLKSYVVHRPTWRPRDNNDEREDYSGVFLCHARLYKLSDRYGCSKLRELTLQKLRLTLCKFRLHPQRASDAIELIRYSYVHTMDRDSGRDELRALALDFAVCYFREFIKQPAFHQLLSEGGPLSSDFLTEIAPLVS